MGPQLLPPLGVLFDHALLLPWWLEFVLLQHVRPIFARERLEGALWNLYHVVKPSHEFLWIRSHYVRPQNVTMKERTHGWKQSQIDLLQQRHEGGRALHLVVLVIPHFVQVVNVWPAHK
jgi:hypothetical protein